MKYLLPMLIAWMVGSMIVIPILEGKINELESRVAVLEIQNEEI